MSGRRHITACLALALAGLLALEAQAQSTRERTLQFALENVLSGTPISARDGTAEIVVRPIRTWKSVSGHWCRRFELFVSEGGGAGTRTEATRCRQDGVWKPLPQE